MKDESEKDETDIEYFGNVQQDYWPCACVKRNPKTKKMTHIRLNHRSVKSCRKCGSRQKDIDSFQATYHEVEKMAATPSPFKVKKS